jgi:hypothetical protein
MLIVLSIRSAVYPLPLGFQPVYRNTENAQKCSYNRRICKILESESQNRKYDRIRLRIKFKHNETESGAGMSRGIFFFVESRFVFLVRFDSVLTTDGVARLVVIPVSRARNTTLSMTS